MRNIALYLLEIRVVRFLGVGGVSTFVHLSIFFSLTEFAGVKYWISNLIAFVPSVALNFALQKLWTFRNKTWSEVEIQFVLFVLKTLLLVGIDVGLLYVLVEYFHVWPLAAKIILLAPLAYASYLITRWIFHR